MNRFVLLLSLFVSPAFSANGCYVFGDSLTSPSFSWANQLIRDGKNLQVNAVPGRTLLALEIPPDTKKTHEIDCAIIHLGSNDAGSGQDINEFKNKYIEVIKMLEGNRLKVYCVLPPYNELGTPVEPFRQVVKEVCPNILDVPSGFYIDGVHMNAFGHLLHGYILWDKINYSNHK